MSRNTLVVGFGVTGRAVAAALLERGAAAVVVDDDPGQDALEAAGSLGVDLIARPDAATLADLLAAADVLAPSPGIPDRHPVFGLAAERGVPVISEFDLAAAWDSRPLAAVTGTDGKTTVTVLVTEMLLESGLYAVAAGNTETPLVSAIADPRVDVFVVEASSFRLGHTRAFRPAVATWLNFGPDHLDVHDSLDGYEAAKARIWSDLGPGSVAVGNLDDPVVAGHLRALPPGGPKVVSFGRDGGADFSVVDGVLTGAGQALIPLAELPRQLPHDVENALAAAATAVHVGASVEGVRRALTDFRGLPHRLQLVAEIDGVDWYDDSKATAPHATLAATAGFDSVVLIAGGQNKGLDLAPLSAIAPRLRGVVAIGAAADEVVRVFEGNGPVRVATSMTEAVEEAASMARRGDAVLLSPGCASFDWYGSYGERGDDFTSKVKELVGEGT